MRGGGGSCTAVLVDTVLMVIVIPIAIRIVIPLIGDTNTNNNTLPMALCTRCANHRTVPCDASDEARQPAEHPAALGFRRRVWRGGIGAANPVPLVVTMGFDRAVRTRVRMIVATSAPSVVEELKNGGRRL